ncbi:P-loop containing nucleoside triphosphate hydrolase protein [Thelephora terrestris]|uniref:P-loop containing nucleoside triphosphate hydrolase protein n=1 Tax=Thelephora terrestris TaxID=56493 RepID=A0A9P6HDH3_9AGAM|nr:P-loop containing nucleoside triphosphate hydrolase protein [Thelephora terrestris]
MGGMLGDDMGLGKTIQIISFLSAIMRKTGTSKDEFRRRDHVAKLQDTEDWSEFRKLPPANDTWPTALIIAPSSVAMNWQRELETWGYFEVGMYIEGRAKRKDVLKDFTMGRLDIIVTTFELARDDIELLCDQHWSCIIVDEVHRVKNPKSRTSKTLNMFQCPVRLGLTGTAIQNNYTEFWTMLDWANPEALGTLKEWTKYVSKPLAIGQSKNSKDIERIRAKRVATILKDNLLPHYFKRRTKDIIKAQLPHKFDRVVFCPLTDTQTAVYERLLQTPNVQNILRRNEECDCGSKKPRHKCHHKMDLADIFRYMATFIKVSNHLALILPGTYPIRQRNREIAQLAFGDRIPLWGVSIHLEEHCGKWKVLQKLLEEWHKEKSNKVLVFTKSVKLLEILEYHVESQNWGYERLDGSTEQSERMPMIDRFHKNPDTWIFLISTLAGGTGLNLVGANKVVIFDPNWNPAHDLQAIDRAFRIGQSRDVEVFRLLGAGSIEELIYARQVYKQQQMRIGYDASVQTRYFEGVQNDKDRQGELFGLQNIFKLHKDTLATKMAIEEAHLADLDWALANMGGATSKKDANEIHAAEKRTSGQEGDDFSGLGAFLLNEVNKDDTMPTPPTEISETLKDIGIKYSHVNDRVLRDNPVQRARIQKAEKVRTSDRPFRKRKSTKRSEEPEAPVWPPRRKNHKKTKPSELVSSRRDAIMGLGLVKDASEMPQFAEHFVTMSEEEQSELIARLNEYRKVVAPSFVNQTMYYR